MPVYMYLKLFLAVIQVCVPFHFRKMIHVKLVGMVMISYFVRHAPMHITGNVWFPH